MNHKNQIPFYLFIGAVFIIITAPALFSEGMVMDGVLYASISRNMSDGLGTFWKPHLSHGLFPEFYEHPPLALGLQSLWFRVFGDSIYVERFYSLFAYFLMGLVIVAIWKQFTNSYRTGWIPLLFYFSMLKISWACANNMLENTMSVFIGLSILFYLKGICGNKIYLIIVSGLFLFLATLTKGLVGLYVWGFPFFLWLFNRELKFGRIAINTGILIAVTVIPFALMILFWPEASNNLVPYFNKQVFGSIQNSVTVDHRFFIVIAVVYHAVPSLLIAFIILLTAFLKKINWKGANPYYGPAFALLLLALGGILPITISMKQSGHYAITVYPYIAIAIGLMLYPVINQLIETINPKSIKLKVFVFFTYGLVGFAILFSYLQMGKISYESTKVSDCHLIIQEIGKNKTINICPEMQTEWSLHGYFARYGNVSLDKKIDSSCEYLITDNKCKGPIPGKDYKEIELDTKEIRLYKKE
ncbi:MAG: glycosyltransferase family 39 protein [Salinivirgaceae bacterium]|nr:glycosyltransferase family 39 protein [Salinivirgaceae bacterium]